MSIITIEFDTEKDEMEAINEAINAQQLSLSLHKIKEYLRGAEKYFQNREGKSEEYNSGYYEATEHIRNDIVEIINSHMIISEL